MIIDPRLNADTLRDYFSKVIKAGGLGSISREATNIKIDGLSKLGGGISNDIYGVSLTCLDEGKIQEIKIVLKVYKKYARIKCWNEGQVLKALGHKNCAVPHLFIQETNERVFGSPFIIMEKVEGKPMGGYLKKLRKKEKLALIRRFAKTLAFLHKLRWEDSGPKFLRAPIDEYEFARQQAITARNLKNIWNVKQDFDGAINWLEDQALLHPCHHYCLIHGDMHLDNFLLTPEGKIVAVDWERTEIGDALKDVGLAYHNIRLSLGSLNEGGKLGEYFIQQYIESSNRKIDHSTLRFYLFSTALLEALSYRHNSAHALHPLSVKRILGRKYMPVFPFVWWYFRSKAQILESFLEKELVSVHS